MERSLVLSAFALGCVGLLCSVVAAYLARPKAGSSPVFDRPFIGAALLLPVAVLLISLASKPPFSEGQGFGRGFGLGGGLALLASWCCACAMKSRSRFAVATCAASWFWGAAATACVPVLWQPNTSLDMLSGISIGAFSVAATLWFGSLGRAGGLLLPVGAAVTAATCGAVALGVIRGADMMEGMRWSAVGVVMAAASALALFISTLPVEILFRPFRKIPGTATLASKVGGGARSEEERHAREAVWDGIGRCVIASAITVIAAWLLSTRLLEAPRFLMLACIGLAAGALCWWLLATGSATSNSSPANRGALALLVFLAASIASFQLYAGLGVGVMTISAWPIVGIALLRSQSDAFRNGDTAGASTDEGILLSLVTCGFFATILVLYRTAFSRFSDSLVGVGFTDHYALFAFMVGILAPGCVAATARANPCRGVRLFRLVAAAVLCLAIPGLTIVLLKAKAALALVAGLALAAGGVRWALPHRPEAQADNADDKGLTTLVGTSLFSLAMGLAISQWTDRAIAVSDLARDEKVHLLGWVLAGVAVLYIAGEAFARRNTAREQRASAGGAGR